MPGCANRIVRTNAVSAPSRHRALDIVTRTFIPRFADSRPPDLWRGVQVLEQAGWSQSALLPVHYYAAATAEPLLWDFVVDVLSNKHAAGRDQVGVTDVLRFLDRASNMRFEGRHWSKEVSIRVARGLLAALRDFGVLSGAVKKHIKPMLLPPESFAFIARVRHDLGVLGHAALEDPCWRLFFLGETAVGRRRVHGQRDRPERDPDEQRHQRSVSGRRARQRRGPGHHQAIRPRRPPARGVRVEQQEPHFARAGSVQHLAAIPDIRVLGFEFWVLTRDRAVTTR